MQEDRICEMCNIRQDKLNIWCLLCVYVYYIIKWCVVCVYMLRNSATRLSEYV